MIDNGDGTFTIKNTQTGATKTVYGQDLANYGLSVPAGKPAQPSATQQGSDLLRSLGLSFIPNIAADVYDTTQGAMARLTGQNQLPRNYQDPFRTNQEAIDTRDVQNNPLGVVKSGAGELAGIASLGLPAGLGIKAAGILPTAGKLAASGAVRGALNDLSRQGDTAGAINGAEMGLSSAGGAIAEPLMSLLLGGMATARGAGRAIGDTPSTDPLKGAVSESDLHNQIRKAITGKLGNNAAANDLANETISKITSPLEGNVPTSAAGIPNEINQINPVDLNQSSSFAPASTSYQGALRNPTPISGQSGELAPNQLSGKELLNYRQRLDQWFPYVKDPQNAADTAAMAARRVVNQNLYNVSPESVLPNQLYGLYQNPLLSMGGLAPKSLRGVPSALATILGAPTALGGGIGLLKSLFSGGK